VAKGGEIATPDYARNGDRQKMICQQRAAPVDLNINAQQQVRGGGAQIPGRRIREQFSHIHTTPQRKPETVVSTT
jgi:hypothetical protein